MPVFTRASKLVAGPRNSICTPHAHTVSKSFLPLEILLDKEAFHCWNNWPWKYSRGIQHTHTLGYQHSRDRSKSELHWNNHSFHPIACQMEMYSYYFHHNWLQNISKMSKFRIRWSEHRHSLNFFCCFSEQPTSSNISRVHDLIKLFPIIRWFLFAWKCVKIHWEK